MKKIISGLFFRLIKSVETWALLSLLIVSSIYIFYVITDDAVVTCASITREWNGSVVNIDGGDVRDYCFESLGVSALDAYRLYGEPVPDEAYRKLHDEFNLVSEEQQVLGKIIMVLHLFPCMIIIIFIPLFFGRFYSDGTLKNLLACGYSKSKIYFSSLLFTFVIDIALMLINIVIFAVFCLIYHWSPPLYMPLILMSLAVRIFLLFVFSSLSLAALFGSSSKVISFIVGFLLTATLFTSMNSSAVEKLHSSYILEADKEEAFFEEYRKIRAEKGNNVFYERLDLELYDITLYYGDREIYQYNESTLDPFYKAVLYAQIYLDPALTINTDIPYYLLFRDGVMTINFAANLFWILLSTTAGILVFRKRETH